MGLERCVGCGVWLNVYVVVHFMVARVSNVCRMLRNTTTGKNLKATVVALSVRNLHWSRLLLGQRPFVFFMCYWLFFKIKR